MKAGADEVGTGALAGPCAVGIVVIKPGIVPGLRDSKLVEEPERYRLATEIRRKAEFYHVAMRSHRFIDQEGIDHAWFECLQDCVAAVKERFPAIKIMADQAPKWAYRHALKEVMFCPKGDDNVYEIQAASLVAKVTRDRWMRRAAIRYPNYGFEIHKGYGVTSHTTALKKYGPCEIHRKTWKSCQKSKNEVVVDLGMAMVWTERLMPYIGNTKRMSDWERKFVSSVQRDLISKKAITPRQMFFLSQTYRRLIRRLRNV